MKISIIVAASTNNVIGRDGGLPWRLPEDLKRFKQITMGKPMIMGRATWDSIGRALPGRQNIVMTRQEAFAAEGCDVVATIDEALEAAGDVEEVMIIGGGNLYEQFLPKTERLYFTRVHARIDGDTYFPEILENEWELVSEELFPACVDREYAFDMLVMDRI
jgi:dihydrofolate reductase